MTFKRLITTKIIVLILVLVSTLTAGTVIYEFIHSPAIEGNLLGDSASRQTIVYLPPGYDQNLTVRYPVIYLLHGITNKSQHWFDTSLYNGSYVNIKTWADTLISLGTIKPFIIVMPDAYNKYKGSYYTNSIVTGGWEDFISNELVTYIDNNYRTLQQSQSRGIAGHSMGGYGAIKLAMKHPDIYGAAYGFSPAQMAFEDLYMGWEKPSLIAAVKANNFDILPWIIQSQIAQAAALSPNPDAQPFLCDFPIDTNGVFIDSTWQKWLLHDPFTMIASYRENLLQLKGIGFDCGNYDPLLPSIRIFSQALTDAGIPHVYEEFWGDHTKQLKENIGLKMLPFFSEVLADIATVSIQTQTTYEFSLSQNYPNPFNPNTTIVYSLPHESVVDITVYNILGKEVNQLISKKQLPGEHSIHWNGTDYDGSKASAGIYLFKIQAGDFVQTKKMVLMK
ncbi:alpha/beta hydrolase-fold protein [Candidatus Neomarinimicrobiota bacterium]